MLVLAALSFIIFLFFLRFLVRNFQTAITFFRHMEFIFSRKKDEAVPKFWKVPNVQYLNTGLDKHRLDLYLPSNVSFDRNGGAKEVEVESVSLPVVFHVHGGGWKRGDRSIWFYGAPYIGAAFAERGFVQSSSSLSHDVRKRLLRFSSTYVVLISLSLSVSGEHYTLTPMSDLNSLSIYMFTIL